MEVILYLSNQLVQAVEVKKKGRKIMARRVWQEEAPGSSIINGIITDEEAFLPFIKNFFSRNKIPSREVALVIGSSQFNHKVMEFPRLSDRELRKLIEREFAENKKEDILYSYYVLEEKGRKGMQKIMAAAVSKEFLLSYLELFRKAGIGLGSIDSETGSLVCQFSHSPEIQKQTCLVQVLDGQEVGSYLFDRGVYFYSQKNRLFRTETEEELAEELIAIQGKLSQFASAQKLQEPLEKFYICGQGAAVLKREKPELDCYHADKVVCPGRSMKKKPDFIYPAGILLEEEKGTSFLEQIKREQKKKKKQYERFMLCLPSLCVLVLVLAAAAGLGGSYYRNLEKLYQIQETMGNEELAGKKASYELSMTKVETMKVRIRDAQEAWEKLMSYPTFDASIWREITGSMGNGITVELKNFNRDSGVIGMNASAADPRQISGFIAALQEKDIFESVEYSGYTYADSTESYTIHVVCCLTEGAGR